MKRTLLSLQALLTLSVLLVLAVWVASISPPGNTYAVEAREDIPVSIRERDGTFRPAASYEPALVGPEYRSNPPIYQEGDNYARDEIIIRFKPEVTLEEQSAFMAEYNMRFGRLIYGERAFVAKVPEGTALDLANSLRDNPLLEMAGVNTYLEFQYDPNDPLASDQEHLDEDHINAREAWDYGWGLGAVSLIAVLDSGIDA